MELCYVVDFHRWKRCWPTDGLQDPCPPFVMLVGIALAVCTVMPRRYAFSELLCNKVPLHLYLTCLHQTAINRLGTHWCYISICPRSEWNPSLQWHNIQRKTMLCPAWSLKDWNDYCPSLSHATWAAVMSTRFAWGDFRHGSTICIPLGILFILPTWCVKVGYMIWMMFCCITRLKGSELREEDVERMNRTQTEM